jgi:hypothetical protein
MPLAILPEEKNSWVKLIVDFDKVYGDRLELIEKLKAQAAQQTHLFMMKSLQLTKDEKNDSKNSASIKSAQKEINTIIETLAKQYTAIERLFNGEQKVVAIPVNTIKEIRELHKKVIGQLEDNVSQLDNYIDDAERFTKTKEEKEQIKKMYAFQLKFNEKLKEILQAFPSVSNSVPAVSVSTSNSYFDSKLLAQFGMAAAGTSSATASTATAAQPSITQPPAKPKSPSPALGSSGSGS